MAFCNIEEIQNEFLLDIYNYRASGAELFKIRPEHLTARDEFGRSCLHIALLKVRNYDDYASKLEYRQPPQPAHKFFGWPSLLGLEKIQCRNTSSWGQYSLYKDHPRVPDVCININLVKKLFDAGADVNALDCKGNSCLHYAVENGGCCEVISLLLTASHCANLDAKNALQDTPLLTAIKVDNLEAVAILIQRGAYIHASNLNGDTGLHVAGDDTVLCLLLNSGCKTSVNCINNCGCSPFLAAVGYCEAETLRRMIQTGANVNFRHKETNECSCPMYTTPLSVALSRKRDEIVEILLEHGADPNEIQTIYFYQPEGQNSILLHAAESFRCSYNRQNQSIIDTEDEKIANILQSLITHGADVCDSAQPFRIVIRQGNLRAVHSFLNEFYRRGVRVPTNPSLLHVALENRRNDVFRFFLDSHFNDLEEVDSNGYTVLHRAIKNAQKERAEMLLDYGADINTVNNEDETVLDCGIRNQDVDCVALLLSHGSLPHWRISMTNIDVGPFHELLTRYVIRARVEIRSILMHLALIGSVGNPISPCIADYVEDDVYPESLREFYQSCKIEIGLSKVSVIYNSITVHGILTRIDYQYAKNENLMARLRETDFSQQFPIYENLIRGRIVESQKRLERMMASMESLHRILKIDCQTFSHIYENILYRLRPVDLLKLQQI